MIITSARTKSGKTVQVLELLDTEIVDATIEGRLHEAARLASERGCHSWRIRSAGGALIAQGKAGQGLLTDAEAWRQFGGDR